MAVTNTYKNAKEKRNELQAELHRKCIILIALLQKGEQS